MILVILFSFHPDCCIQDRARNAWDDVADYIFKVIFFSVL